MLGSNFLCSRQFEERQKRTRIVPTIAYDLARQCKPYANALYAASNFVIDALDEIKGDGGLTFLRDLLAAIDEYDLRGVKFLVTSRSDPEVVKLSESFASKATCDLREMGIEKAKVDVEMYLKVRLKHLNGRSELDELVKRAGGLFIYAATAVRYLTTFLCTAERTSASTVSALVPGGAEETVKAVLRDLHAVLYTQNDRVFCYHASFPDFIFTQARSNPCIGKKDFLFSCNEPSHQLLAESCFHIMKSGLRFNMGNIASSFLFDSDNAVALSEQVNQNINDSLKYSSRYWAHHLACAELINTDDLCRCISDFLQCRILFWIEGMNLLGFRDHCTPMLQHARQWVLKVGIIWYELCCIS